MAKDVVFKASTDFNFGANAKPPKAAAFRNRKGAGPGKKPKGGKSAAFRKGGGS